MTRLLTPAVLVLVAAAAALVPVRSALAHCQIPCGIFDDDQRFHQMSEMCDTLEKSMKQIAELSAKPAENANQIVRWVQAKEDHAEQLAGLLRSYFLQQRIKAPAPEDEAGQKKYVELLKIVHGMLVEAMKAKQTTETAHVDNLRKLLEELQKTYTAK